MRNKTPAKQPNHCFTTWYVVIQYFRVKGQNMFICIIFLTNQNIFFILFFNLFSGKCPFGWFKNVTEPRVYTEGEYPGLYKYGAWGRDPRPEPGKESWYWVVMLTSGNSYSNYVRRYSSLRALIAGENVPGKTLLHSLPQKKAFFGVQLHEL